MPGKGIWFITTKGSEPGENTIFLDEETDMWTSEPMWSTHRHMGCAVRINETTVANIGGKPKPANSNVGKTIDLYNFEPKTEQIAVKEMTFNRRHHGCALIPSGPSGNPTVAIRK